MGENAVNFSEDDFDSDLVTEPLADPGDRAEANISRLDLLLAQDRKTLVMSCTEAITALQSYEADRSETNADMNALRKSLFAKGISKYALKAAISVSKLQDRDMDGFSLSLSVLLEAVGRPVDVPQMDLFSHGS